MKRVLLVLLLSLVLCGCGKKEDGLIFPEIEYAKEPMVTLPPKPIPVPSVDIPSRLETLKVMDEGFAADAAACIDNTMLVADIYSKDYQLVWLKLAKNSEMPVPIERKVIREDRAEQQPDETRICDVFAADGFYYVLLSELPPYYLVDVENMKLGEENYIENKDFAGRARIEKYDAEGNLVSILSLSELPVSTVKKILVLSNGDIFVLGLETDPEAEGALRVVLEYEVCLLLDGESGEILSKSIRKDRSISSISSDGSKILAFFDDFGTEEPGFVWLDPNSGEASPTGISWEYGVFDWPYCIQGLNNMIMLNNQLSFSGLL